jgi:hypothetical protein
MAGLLDYLYTPNLVQKLGLRKDTPLFDITASQGQDGWNINLGRPGSLTGDTFSDRFGGMQEPTQQPVQSAPQMQSPQDAAQSFGLPTSSYQFGNQMVPTYGQPQAPQPIEASAQRRGAESIQINPQGNPVAPAAVAPGATETGRDKWMAALDRLSPDYVSRYRQTKQQQQTTQALATFFQGQGMAPQQAAAMAAVASSNPKVLEEILKPYPNMQARIASQYRGGGANPTKEYTDFLTAEKAAEKAGAVQGESRAQAQIDLPKAVASAQEQLRLLDELSNHPGRKQIGWHDFLGKAPLLPSSKGYDAANLLEQIKGGAFKQAFESLKGGGAITEQEGKAATAAEMRMDRATSKGEFDKALDDYKGIIRLGIDRANQKAGQAAPFGFQGNQGWGQLPGGARFKKVSD